MSLKETESTYVKLLHILITVVNANEGQERSERIAVVENFVLKFVSHCLSSLYLFYGTKLKEFDVNFNDQSSINVIARAAMESLLAFSYLFIIPTSDYEREFRFDSWILCDLINEKNFFTKMKNDGHEIEKNTQNQLDQSKIQIAALQKKIKANPLYLNLTSKERDKFGEGLIWRRYKDTWSQIGLDMGLDNTHARAFYSYLCSYSHSGSKGISQIKGGTIAEQQRSLAVTMKYICIAMAHMINLYAKVFPKSREELGKIADAEKVVKQWIDIGAGKEPVAN